MSTNYREKTRDIILCLVEFRETYTQRIKNKTATDIDIAMYNSIQKSIRAVKDLRKYMFEKYIF